MHPKRGPFLCRYGTLGARANASQNKHLNQKEVRPMTRTAATSTSTLSIRWGRRLGLVLALLGLIAVESAQAQTALDALRFSQRSPATGARMMGFGGASIAGFADPSALFTNPAGLARYQTSEISGSLLGFSTLDQGDYLTPDFITPFESDVRDYGFGNLAYIAKAPTTQGSLVVGIAYNQTNLFDRNLAFAGENATNSISEYFLPINTRDFTEYEVTRLEEGEDPETVEILYGQTLVDDTYVVDFDPDGDGFINRPLSLAAFQTFGIDLDPEAFEAGDYPFLPAVNAGTVFQQGAVVEEGSMKEVNIGGAVEAAKDVMLGLSANVSFGTYRFERTFQEFDDFNDNDGTGGTFDFNDLMLTEAFESDLLGFNVRGGLSSKVGPGLRVGITLESPTFYTVTENYSTRLQVGFDNGDFDTYGDDFEEDAGTGEFEYQIRTPWRLGGGLAFDAGVLVLSADVEAVDWSRLRLDSDTDSFDDVNQAIEDSLDIVVNGRLGAQFRLGNLALRAGFALQPDPRSGILDIGEYDPRNDEERPRRTRQYYSLGVGIRLADNIHLDAGWMQERFNDAYQPYLLDPANPEGSPFVEETVVRDRISLGLRFGF